MTEFSVDWSWDNMREFLNIVFVSMITLAVSLGPIFIIILCFIVYAWLGMVSLLWILGVYLCTYWSNFPIHKRIERWGCGLDFWKHLRRAMNGKIIIDRDHKPNVNQKYMFAYHPHGAFPVTLSWLLNSTEFRSHYGIDQNEKDEGLKDLQVLMTSLAFYMPFVREICIGAGGKAITKGILTDTLKANKHVLLCPGGVAEMYLTPPINSDEAKVLNISTKHKGFIKNAIKHGRPIIPILSFGEQDLFTVTKWSTKLDDWLKERVDKRVTFPWFSGRYNLPIPRNVPITCVIGEPMEVEKISKPTQEVVDKYHKKFSKIIEDLFYKYRDHPDVGVRYSGIHFIND